MTELEQEFLDGLVTAAWPFPLQVVFGVALAAGYFLWSRLYFRALDPALRGRLGRALGARVVWVHRHSASYPTPLETGFRSYRRWSWGIEEERERTLLRDGAAAALSVVCVNLVGGLWPIAVFLFVALELRALSYVVLMPVCLAALVIYSVFWSGRYEAAGMRTDLPAGRAPAAMTGRG
jgi:hypothetical protein